MADATDEGRLSRRQFLRSAGAAGVAFAAPRRLRSLGGRQSVAIFGGGIAGLTAAHELALRGFDVTVYERRAWGGKARSTLVPDSAEGGRRPLPGEHGFRIEFGFYQNLPETLRAIPFGSNPNGVFDNLVGGSQFVWAREGGHDLVMPARLDKPAHTPAQVVQLLIGLLLETDLPPEAAARFAGRMSVFLSSCDARRLGQWDNIDWSAFIGAAQYSADYRKLLGETVSQLLQASKVEHTSAYFCAWVFELAIYALTGRGANGPLLRVFDAPTDEAWIEPWVTELDRLGVRLRKGLSLEAFDVHGDRITAARVRGSDRGDLVHADWYICALPVERASQLWSDEILAVDPVLRAMRMLETDWMNGIQFYLREPARIANGHVVCVDSPWAVSFVSQAQFWRDDFSAIYGDGKAQDCLSAIASNWNRSGVVFGKVARDCTPEQVALEVWEQIKRHMNDTGRARLTDDMLHSWHLDPGLVWADDRFISEDPLVLPTAGSRPYRPGPATAIQNLFLAGDYLNGDWHVANMEAANYNGRRAANAVLDEAGSNETRSQVSNHYRPPEWEAAKAIDDDRYKRGQPNLLDIEATGPLPSRDRELVRQLGLESILDRRPVAV